MPAAASPTMPLATALERLARRPDADAWAAVVEAIGEDLHRLACRLTGDAALADDAVQEVLLIVRDRADAFTVQSTDANADARRWITRIGINVSLKLLRSQQRITHRERSYAETVPTDTTEAVEAQTVRSEHAALLRRALAELPEPVRAAIVLHHISGAGFREVAKHFGCPIGTVKARVSRGLLTLRQLLQKDGVVLSTGAISLAMHRLPVPTADPSPLLAGCHQLLHTPLTASIPGLPAPTVTGMTLAGKVVGLACALVLTTLGVGIWMVAHRAPRPPPAPTPVAHAQAVAVVPPMAPPAPIALPVPTASHLARATSLLIPPACAVLMVGQPLRALEHLERAGISAAALGGTPPQSRLGELLDDPQLRNLAVGPILIIISRGSAEPGSAMILPCVDPRRYVEAATAKGWVGQAVDSLAVLGSTSDALAAANPTAMRYRELASAAVGTLGPLGPDARLQFSPRQLCTDFGALLQNVIRSATAANAQPASQFGLDTMLAIGSDIDLVTLDLTLVEQSLLVGCLLNAHPGGALATALVQVPPRAGPTAASHLQPKDALFALTGRYPSAALGSYANALIFDPAHPSPFASVFKPDLLPLLRRCSMLLTGDVAVRLLPAPDGWLSLEQVSGSDDAAASQEATRQLLRAEEIGGLDLLGLRIQRQYLTQRRDGLDIDTYSYAVSDSHITNPALTSALTRVLNPCATTSTPGFIYVAPDADAVLALAHAPASGSGLHTHAESVLPAGEDGYWDLDPAGFMRCFTSWVRPLITGIPAAGTPVFEDADHALICGSWAIADGNCRLQVRIPHGDRLAVWLAGAMAVPSDAPEDVPALQPAAVPTTPPAPVRPLF